MRTYIENCDFVDALWFIIWLCGQVLVDVFKIWNGDISLEVFIEDDVAIDKVDLLGDSLSSCWLCLLGSFYHLAFAVKYFL